MADFPKVTPTLIMKNYYSASLLTFILLLFCYSSFSQIADPINFHDDHECCKKARQVHKKRAISSYGYDMIFQRIEHYSHPAQAKLKGTVSCHIKTEENIDTIRLDMAESLVIDSIMYHGNNLTYIHQDYVLKIVLPTTLISGIIDSVSISYEGFPGTSEAYENDFHGALSPTIPVIWTDSEPYYSRDWYPCKMTLDDKIDSIDLIISCPLAYRSASNGLIVSETINNGIRTTHWKHRYPIAHYLVAYAVTNYEVNIKHSIMPNGDTLEIHNYVWPEDNGAFPDLPHSQLPEVLEYFNDIFIPYPFAEEKYGHARWLGPGAMENQTMTFTHDYNISILSHELAHHWFGNYITCGSWQDIWLNESFATFTEGLVHEEYYPQYWLNWKKGRIDYITSDPGGSVFVYDTTYFSNIFNSRLTYRKGALMIFMLRWEIGEEAFFEGINNYLNDPDLAHSFARSEDIITYWELAADTSLTEFFNDWLYGEGYPSYDLSYSQESNNEVELIINQTQSIETANFFEMHVPVRFEGLNEDSIFVFHNLYDGQVFQFNPGFEVVNIEFDPEYNLISRNNSVYEITEVEFNNGLWVYPNPVSDVFMIKSTKNHDILSVKLFNIGGENIKTFDIRSNSYINSSYDISEFPAGSYFVKIDTKDGSSISKLIIL